MDLKNRDFLKIADFTREELALLLDLAARLKALRKAGREPKFLTGKKISLTKKVAATLLKTGRIPVKGIFSEKTGKSYDAVLTMSDDGKKTLYALDFSKESQ